MRGYTLHTYIGIVVLVAGLSACGSRSYDPVDPNPKVSGLADQSIAQDTATSVNFTVSDADSGAAALTITAVSSDTALVAVEGITVSGSGANRTLQITPTADAYGETTITVRATDPGSRVATSSFKLRINGVFVPVSTATLDAFAVDDSGDPRIVNGMTFAGDVDEDPAAFDTLL